MLLLRCHWICEHRLAALALSAQHVQLGRNGHATPTLPHKVLVPFQGPSPSPSPKRPAPLARCQVSRASASHRAALFAPRCMRGFMRETRHLGRRCQGRRYDTASPWRGVFACVLLCCLQPAAGNAEPPTVCCQDWNRNLSTCSRSVALLRSQNTPLPEAGHESGACTTVMFSSACSMHITDFEPLIDSDAIHHVLLYMTASTQGSGADCCTRTCPAMPSGREWMNVSQLLFGWTRGGRPLSLPPHVGLRVGPGWSATLQTHYHRGVHDRSSARPSHRHRQRLPEYDHSGIKLTLDSELRPHDMAWLVASGATSFSIPPRQRHFVIRVTTSLPLIAPANAFWQWLHAHSSAVRVEAWISRRGQFIASLGKSAPFHHANSSWEMLRDEVQILPGDQANIECEYSTVERASCTAQGSLSTQEMCSLFLGIYPAQSAREIVSLGTVTKLLSLTATLESCYCSRCRSSVRAGCRAHASSLGFRSRTSSCRFDAQSRLNGCWMVSSKRESLQSMLSNCH